MNPNVVNPLVQQAYDAAGRVLGLSTVNQVPLESQPFTQIPAKQKPTHKQHTRVPQFAQLPSTLPSGSNLISSAVAASPAPTLPALPALSALPAQLPVPTGSFLSPVVNGMSRLLGAPSDAQNEWWNGWISQPVVSPTAPSTPTCASGYSLLTTPGNGLHPAEDLLEDYRLFCNAKMEQQAHAHQAESQAARAAAQAAEDALAALEGRHVNQVNQVNRLDSRAKPKKSAQATAPQVLCEKALRDIYFKSQVVEFGGRPYSCLDNWSPMNCNFVSEPHAKCKAQQLYLQRYHLHAPCENTDTIALMKITRERAENKGYLDIDQDVKILHENGFAMAVLENYLENVDTYSPQCKPCETEFNRLKRGECSFDALEAASKCVSKLVAAEKHARKYEADPRRRFLPKEGTSNIQSTDTSFASSSSCKGSSLNSSWSGTSGSSGGSGGNSSHWCTDSSDSSSGSPGSSDSSGDSSSFSDSSDSSPKSSSSSGSSTGWSSKSSTDSSSWTPSSSSWGDTSDSESCSKDRSKSSASCKGKSSKWTSGSSSDSSDSSSSSNSSSSSDFSTSSSSSSSSDSPCSSSDSPCSSSDSPCSSSDSSSSSGSSSWPSSTSKCKSKSSTDSTDSSSTSSSTWPSSSSSSDSSGSKSSSTSNSSSPSSDSSTWSTAPSKTSCSNKSCSRCSSSTSSSTSTCGWSSGSKSTGKSSTGHCTHCSSCRCSSGSTDKSWSCKSNTSDSTNCSKSSTSKDNSNSNSKSHSWVSLGNSRDESCGKRSSCSTCGRYPYSTSNARSETSCGSCGAFKMGHDSSSCELKGKSAATTTQSTCSGKSDETRESSLSALFGPDSISTSKQIYPLDLGTCEFEPMGRCGKSNCRRCATPPVVITINAGPDACEEKRKMEEKLKQEQQEAERKQKEEEQKRAAAQQAAQQAAQAAAAAAAAEEEKKRASLLAQAQTPTPVSAPAASPITPIPATSPSETTGRSWTKYLLWLVVLLFLLTSAVLVYRLTRPKKVSIDNTSPDVAGAANSEDSAE